MSRYSKPPGYNTLHLVNGLNGRSYKPYNGFISGSENYAPGQYSPQVATLTFASAPDDLSTIDIPDGPTSAPGTPTKTFTFVYGGAPGVGVIPLDVGGGTAAQAVTAAVNVLAAQLTYWSVLASAATVLRLTSRQPGVNTLVVVEDTASITLSTVLASLLTVLPARFGKNYAWLANDTVNVPTPPS